MRIFPIVFAIAASLALPASSQTIERIKATGEMKLGFRTDAAPLSYANENGDAAGYSPLLCAGIAQAVAENLELEDLAVSFHPVDASDRFEKVASGEIDLLCGAATITMSRREIVDFSVPTYVDGSVMLLTRNATGNFKELAGKRIGVRESTTTATALANTIAKAGIEAETVPFQSHDDGVNAMRDGEIDAYFADQSILVYQLASKGLGSDLRLTTQLLTVEKQGLALARGDSDFRLLIDRIISKMYETGAMKRVYQQSLPGLQPGMAMRALHLMSPTLP